MVGLVYALATFTVAGGDLRVSSLQKGLVGHWMLDSEGYNSATERITDKTPYENHGTNYGATLTTDRMGQSNRAMYFDGSSDYVDAGNGDSLDMNTNDFSIAVWINASFEPNQIRILVIENGSSMGGWDTKLISLGYDVTIDSSITTKAEVDAYNPDIVACLKYAWGCTKVALLNELYDAGYLIFSEGNDQTNNIRPIETTEFNNTQAGTIQADESHPITNGWSTTGGSGTDGRHGITAIHANAYSIANDSSLNYTEAVYLEEPGKGRWYHHQPTAVATDKLIENAVYYLTRYEIVSKGNSYNLFLNNYTLKGFINNETVNTTISSGWNHVSLTYDGATQKLYVNSELKESNSFSSSIETNSDNLTIGTIFNGSISDVRIYNRALSTDEIDTLYHSYRPKTSSGSLQKGLVLDMPLNSKYTKDETAGSEIMTDRTPYSNDGQNYGANVGTDYTTFDGVDNYVEAFPVPSDIGAFSVVLWINTTRQNDFVYYIHRGISASIGGSIFCLGEYANYLMWAVNGRYEAGKSSTLIPESEFICLVGTYDGDKARLFLNGDLIHTDTFGAITSEPSGNKMGIGGTAHPYANRFTDGSISDVRIYNRVLSAQEIKLLYDKGR